MVRFRAEEDSRWAAQRAHQRLPASVPVLVHEIDRFGEVLTGWSATLADISRGGVGVHSRRLTVPGMRLAVLIPAPEGKPKVLFGEVRNAQYIDAGIHHIGVQFCAAPSEAGVQRWLIEHGVA